VHPDLLPDLSGDLCARLREAFLNAGYTADGVVDALGPQAHAALGRGEPEPARRASRDAGALGTLIRLFLLGDQEPEQDVRKALGGVDVDDAVKNEILTKDLKAGLDVRPYEDNWWVIADLDSDLRGGAVPEDHVLGVGHASISLARATRRTPVGTLLDLGTGCGVQALHASTHADRMTATDLSERALRLAQGTFRINNLDVETLQGEWFGPVRNRRFDQVVCNPPFVVGPPRVDYVYRDSGLGGDDASALVIRQLPAFLNEGGVGQLLASWVHRKGEDWEERVSSWLPRGGIDAWFVQRDIAEPALYAGTWLKDAGVDPRSPEGRAKASAWLDWFEENEVQGVGFGYVTLRRTDKMHSQVVCEDLRHAYDDPLGPEAARWLDNVAWLRANPDLLGQRFRVADTVLLEEVSEPSEDGWRKVVARLHRTDGPGWQHEVDEATAKLIAGCNGALPLEDLLALLEFAYGEIDAEAALPIVRDLVRHGMLIPT
jgi:methylase of polypeptide subunit release factors